MLLALSCYVLPHSSGVKKGPAVEGCEFSYAMDDYFNVHSRVQVGCGTVEGATSHGP